MFVYNIRITYLLFYFVCATSDSVFNHGDMAEFATTPNGHARNPSTSTTTSEREFKKQFNSVSRRVVKRADSQQEYKRYTVQQYGRWSNLGCTVGDLTWDVR